MVTYCVVCQRETEETFICRNCGTLWKKYLAIWDNQLLTQQKVDEFEKALTRRKMNGHFI